MGRDFELLESTPTISLLASIVANSLFALSLYYAKGFSFKNDSLSDLGNNSFGRVPASLFITGLFIAGIGGIPVLVLYIKAYFSDPQSNQSLSFATLSLIISIGSIWLIGLFPGVRIVFHLYASAAFLCSFTLILLFLLNHDFRIPNLRLIAFVWLCSLIILWGVFATFFVNSENHSLGFAIPEIVMIILFTLNLNLMVFRLKRIHLSS